MNFSWILIILGAMMWGTDGVLLTPKYFEYGLYNVLLIVFIAHLVPLIALSIFQNKEYLKAKKFSRDNWIFLILIAIFGGTLGTLSIVEALKLSNYNPKSLVILIQKSQPIFAIISAYFILKEKPNKKFYYISAISLVSLYFMTFGFSSPFSLEVSSLLAALFSLIAAMSFGISTTFSRKVSMSLESKTVSFYRYLLTATITCLLLIITSLFGNSTLISDISVVFASKNILLLTVIISVWNVIAIRLYYKGLESTKAIYSTICELAYPITSVLLDMFVNKTTLDPVRLIAAAVLIISIIHLNFGNKE